MASTDFVRDVVATLEAACARNQSVEIHCQSSGTLQVARSRLLSVDDVAAYLDSPQNDGRGVRFARRAVEVSGSGRIGVIGTRGTIASGAYQRAIESLRPDAEVLCRSCPLFVPLAEEGWTDNAIARQVAESYLAPFKKVEIDTLVLGCTHYPLLRGVIGEVMGPAVQLVDSAEAVTAEVRRHLDGDAASDSVGDGPVVHHFFVTDVPEPFQAVAERFLGRPILRLERARIEGD